MAKKNGPKPPTKSEIMTNMAEATGMSKKEVAAFFDALNAEIGKAVGKRGPGMFTIPGLCKIVVKHVPAKPRRQVRNPATGETIQIPAKRVLKFRVAKAAKDSISLK